MFYVMMKDTLIRYFRMINVLFDCDQRTNSSIADVAYDVFCTTLNNKVRIKTFSFLYYISGLQSLKWRTLNDVINYLFLQQC